MRTSATTAEIALLIRQHWLQRRSRKVGHTPHYTARAASCKLVEKLAFFNASANSAIDTSGYFQAPSRWRCQIDSARCADEAPLGRSEGGVVFVNHRQDVAAIWLQLIPVQPSHQCKVLTIKRIE